MGKLPFNFLTREATSAFEDVADAYPMPSVSLGRPEVSDRLYEGMKQVDAVPAELYARYDVKRGLRNADGSGVLVGLTTISNVHAWTYMPMRSLAMTSSGVMDSWQARTPEAM